MDSFTSAILFCIYLIKLVDTNNRNIKFAFELLMWYINLDKANVNSGFKTTVFSI
jgi:hypothetical protein